MSTTWTLKKFLYKWTPITISLSDSWKTIRIDKWSEILLQNYQNKKWASLEQLEVFVKEYLDLWNNSIKLSEYISSKLNQSSFHWDLWIDNDDWFWEDKSYVFGEEPEGVIWHVKELVNLLTHILHYPRAKNIQEINDNITFLCDWGWSWDWIWFEDLYYDDKSLFYKVKSLVEEIALKYPYTSLDSGTSKTIHYMINQWGLFDNEQFTKQEWAENAKFLDSLVDNGTVGKLLNEKRLSGDYKMVLTTRVEQFSNYKGWVEELTKSWSFSWDGMKELTAKDFLSVIFSDFEKEIIKSDWQTFLNFKIALNYFNNLKKSNDWVITIIDDIWILFNNFKCEKTISEVKRMSPSSEKVKEIAKWFVKHIIVSELLEAWVLIDYLREKNLSWQYYWDLDDASYGKLYTALSRTEWITNSTKVELTKKSQLVSDVFESLVEGEENKFITLSTNITRVNMTKTILEKLFSNTDDSVTTSLSIEDLIKLLGESKDWDQESIIQSIYWKIKSKSHFDKLITPVFQNSNFTLQKKLISNLGYLSDLHSCDNFVDTLSDETLVSLFDELLGSTILEKLISLIDDTTKVGKLLVQSYIKTWNEEYIQLLINARTKFTSKENYESLVLSLNSKRVNKKTVLNYLESCWNIDLGKNILTKIEDLWIKQLMYEYLKSKWEKWIEKEYIKDILEKSNYNSVTSEVDLSSLDSLIRQSDSNITETLLTVLEGLKDSKVDSYKYLNLINEKWYLDDLSDIERLQFFVEFIEHLNSWDYESEQLTLSEIYKKIFSSQDTNTITSKIIEKFESLKTSNEERVNTFSKLLNEYLSSANTKKSVIRSFIGWLMWTTDSRSLDEIYKDLLNELQDYKVGIQDSTKVFTKELDNIIILMKQLSSFKELLQKSELGWNEQFLNGISLFEWNLLWVQKRLNLYLDTFNNMWNMVSTLYDKIKGLDALIWIQVIQEVNKELQKKLNELK